MMPNTLLRQIAKIRSKQPWFVLNAEHFTTHISSQSPLVSHYYSFKLGQTDKPSIAIPDGCVDLLFDCDKNQPKAWLCGSTSKATEIYFTPHHRYFGVRFKPGLMPAGIEASASEVIDHQHDLQSLAPHTKGLIERITQERDLKHQVDHLERFLQRKLARPTSALTQQLLATICQHKGNIQVQALEQLSGYSARTLQRQFSADTGFTPKSFSRAIRCQSAVYDINHRHDVVFTELAFELGFSDQSHFLREFKTLISATPKSYQKQIKSSAYQQRLSQF